MALSSWLCASNSKSMYVKIVHPGGRVELHDRPMMAAEIMVQNPRCNVTYPEVFRRPWAAVLSPDSVLLLGHKYYVVPVGTIRRLQRRAQYPERSPKSSLSPVNYSPNSSSPLSPTQSSSDQRFRALTLPGKKLGEGGSNSFCLFFSNKDGSSKASNYSSLPKSDKEMISWEDSRGRADDDLLQGITSTDRSCLTFLFQGSPKRAARGKEGARSSSSSTTGGDQVPISSIGNNLSSSETTRELVINVRGNVGDGAKGLISKDHWQPSLESISEECPAC
ncbi:hypothetical protein H6P81_000170 [Aristolochia fimbriata]|uniref:Uncharacterized protein n=1 Tax=Aristolochia fimbriata TaxID=158543 RepID=A0AAV7F3I4_ARIFI|nr:hypothetical protein H6P81_000170 [Aristolochia fimbriata]